MRVERLIAATVIGLLALATKAETFTLIKAPVTAADWTNGEFYSDGNAPTGSSSDIVSTSVSKELDITIDGTSADFPAITNFLSSISAFQYGAATIRINVPAGQTMTLTRPFYSSVTIDAEIGVVYKTGAGELVLDSCRLLNPSSTSASDHQGDWRVMEGTLRIQPHAPNDVGYWWMMDYNYVAAGAKIIVPATGDKGAWQTLQVEGAGLITNESTTVSRIYKNGSRRKELSSFSGVLSANIQLQVRSCTMDLQGSANRASVTTGTSNEKNFSGTLYLRKLGNVADAESSMGPGNASLPQRFVYTGLGETCDRSLYVHSLDTLVSGGTNGNLRLTGAIASHWSTERRNDALVLAGDNLQPCWLESAINRWGTDGNSQFWDVYIEKTGKGQWNLEHKSSTTAATVAIEDGVLGCGLLSRRGEVSSIGTSTNCHERVEQYDNANAVDYAIMLGDAANASATGLLENTSADAMMMEDRSFALAGCGGFRQNANEGVVKYAGVTGLGSGAKTLVLDGTSSMTNQVYDVADGDGVVSVLKRGPGTWQLGGDLTFSGDLSVEGGMLVVKRFPEDKYGYYRLSVCEVADYNTDYYETPWWESTVDMVQVGLWAADTTRQNMNLKLVRQGELRPGTVAMAWNRTVSGADGGVAHGFNLLELLFSGCRAPYVKGPGEMEESRLWNLFRRGFVPPGATSAARGPQRNVPDSWLNLDMCLAEGAQPVTLFDVACGGGNTAPYFAHSWVTAVKLLGSVDGVHWEDLSGIQDGVKPTGTYRWISTGRSSYEAGAGCTSEDHFDASDPAVDWHKDPTLSVYKRTNGGGFVATNTVPMRKFDMLTQIGAVKVSGGATLKFEGENAPAISRLAVDPVSGGTLDGFSLATSGTLNVLADDFAGQTLTLPLSFSHVDTSAFANWSLQMNGVAKSKSPRFHCRNGVLTVYKAGCAIYMR
ncbi:MAG: autotransporter-associated beta strand repeat-containing protein [Kiritimatiellae bacterium]|nr:autotransporter-associated beta strand repeat-containing protein [Kiritimatiellia bacterium]